MVHPQRQKINPLQLDSKVPASQVAVICMYAAQATKVKQTLRLMELARKGIDVVDERGEVEEGEEGERGGDGGVIVEHDGDGGYDAIKVSTVDAFQGLCSIIALKFVSFECMDRCGRQRSSRENHLTRYLCYSPAGEERDVVIVCVTQSKAAHAAHVGDLRRVNVAITRAQRHLIVTGGYDVLRGVHPWSEITSRADANGGIRDGVEALRYLTG